MDHPDDWLAFGKDGLKGSVGHVSGIEINGNPLPMPSSEIGANSYLCYRVLLRSRLFEYDRSNDQSLTNK